jgi:hypothetical protein
MLNTRRLLLSRRLSTPYLWEISGGKLSVVAERWSKGVKCPRVCRNRPFLAENKAFRRNFEVQIDNTEESELTLILSIGYKESAVCHNVNVAHLSAIPVFQPESPFQAAPRANQAAVGQETPPATPCQWKWDPTRTRN